MKYFFVASTILLLFTSCDEKKAVNSNNAAIVQNSATANGKRDTTNLPKLVFSGETFDFGTITDGDRVVHNFTFTNTGKTALSISGATGSCGCTVPDWPRKPISPNESASIDVVFDSSGKKDKQDKTVTVYSNCEPSQNVLHLVGFVNSIVKDTTKH